MVHIEQITDEAAAELYRLQGNDAFRDSLFDEAIYFYTEALQHQKDNPAIYTNRAAAALKTDNCLQAEADCTEALLLDPNNAKAFHRRAQARQRLGDLAGAADDYQRAMALHGDPSIAQSLKVVQEQLDRREQEHKHDIEVLQEKKKHDADHVDIEGLRGQAKELFQAGQFEAAADMYSLVLNTPLSEADKAMYLNNRAACYFQMKAETEALGDLGAVLAIDPYNTKARLRRAITLENMDRVGPAYDDYKVIMQVDPAGSAKASDAIRRLLSNFPELKQRPTTVLPPRSETTPTSQPQKESQSTPPDSAEPLEEQVGRLKQQANQALRNGDNTGAVGLYSQALNLDPTNAVLYANRAQAHANLGDHNNAVVDAQAAVTHDPAYSKGHFRLGTALTKVGRVKEAISAFVRGRDVDPENKEFTAQIEKLSKNQKN